MDEWTQGRSIRRSGEWLELPVPVLAEWSEEKQLNIPVLKAGSHPHAVRQWLLALAFFPDKWVNRLFSVGGIQLEGDVVRLHAFVPANVEADPLYRLAQKQLIVKTHGEAAVLFEDDWCLVMDKPAGMPVHASAPGQRGTLDEAAACHCLRAGDPMPVKHIHRLDDDTSGPVLYAKNDLAQLRLDESMRIKQIGRQYAALVQGCMGNQRGTIAAPIGKDRHHKARRRVSPAGDEAVTHYEVLETFKEATWVRLTLETGRTHQIRVHLSHIGHPLIGDVLYGGSSRLLPHQALRGEELVFQHPFSHCTITVRSPEPPWFRNVVNQLGTPLKM
ncbi:RluA family pseudouridine synthase [Paenibacillus sepulcri]|uniref:Pseudouridine synthase n=1 Tax=Paenibacillus sepulcri TaxID=359917 RepID=A0ABS7CA55_9BACL|nr:RluA family pseudouridine synthase [Paenibacillus sepulcri]